LFRTEARLERKGWEHRTTTGVDLRNNSGIDDDRPNSQTG
jgi:hypothetical protein